jgi:hypothetical protein
MSASYNLHTGHLLVSLSLGVVEEIRSKCQDQRLRLNIQREGMRANRTKRLERQARQKEKLSECYSLLGLVKRVE